MEMEPAVEKGSGSNGEGNDGPGDTALLGCGKGKRRTKTSKDSTLRGLPQNAGVIISALRRGKSFTAPRRPPTVGTAFIRAARHSSSRKFTVEGRSLL